MYAVIYQCNAQCDIYSLRHVVSMRYSYDMCALHLKHMLLVISLIEVCFTVVHKVLLLYANIHTAC